jgi:acyl-CoA synthetase (AMP-forming)/AMP-acid ligase II/acetyltransferase-like isoleucine patch superfamily enzyme/acyl carrier protein
MGDRFQRTAELSARTSVSRHVSQRSLLDRDITPFFNSISNPLPPNAPTVLPMSSLHERLSSSQRSISSLYESIQSYAKCWKLLPEDAKAGRSTEHDALVHDTMALVKSSYNSLLDLLLRSSNSPAIIDGRTRQSISHRKLAEFVKNFKIPVIGSAKQNDIVAAALPNGALLGLVAISVASYYVFAPIDSTSGAEQFRMDLLRTGAKVVLVLESDIHRLGLDQAWVLEQDIEICITTPSDDMTFTLHPRTRAKPAVLSRRRLNSPDDTCLILFTSGTSGTKKVVPFTLHSIISSVAFVGESWGLSKKDTCLNMMPLNHIGGLARNLFAPILLGGSTICCPAFDPNLFWDLVEEINPTWYYASPSMHSVILDEAPNRQEALRKSEMRMVCNAAGGLLPSLANSLRSTFQCTVLPSYGMTECMPISTPSLDYTLDRPGTSGVSTGPELAILNNEEGIVAAHTVGRVCVRGQPVFSGYLKEGTIDNSVFNSSGWFDTGDLGYMDADGYLYITGRSKEVINRGGELISPFEIEEAIVTQAQKEGSPIYGRVSECLAFSVPHNVLQEVVGVVIVTPSGRPRVDLRQLSEAVKTSLHSTKWPVVLVYMQSLPKRNGKLCRVNLGKRLDFDTVTDEMKLTERHFEATCPPLNTPISISITKYQCLMDKEQVVTAISSLAQGSADVLIKINPRNRLLEAILGPKSLQKKIQHLDTTSIKEKLREMVDGYLIPGRITLNDTPFPRDALGSIDNLYLRTIFAAQARHRRMNSEKVASPLESKICSIYGDLLDIPREDIDKNSDFFELGGDSLRAGRLLSTLRREFSIRIPIDKLFKAPKVNDVCNIIQEYQISAGNASEEKGTPIPLPGSNKTYSSSRIWLLLVQLIPIAIISPFKKAVFWLVFLLTWGSSIRAFQREGSNSHIIYLVLAMLAARSALLFMGPIISVLAKWIIIGRYREGLYPMWSTYHTRWWLVQKTVQICGMGLFKHFNWSRVLFYRCMGAKIGKNVLIQPGTIIDEYDLLEIGDNVELDRCVCRGFAAEHNTTMYLGRIKMGNNSAAGLNTIVAPGTQVPENTCLGMKSSSWEGKENTEANYDQLQSRIPGPHWAVWIVFGIPITILLHILSLLPWIAGLYGLNVADPPEGSDVTLFLVGWFASPTRVAFHFLARVLHVVFSPIVFLAVVIVLKHLMDAVFGKIKPSSTIKRRHIDRFRMALFKELIPNGHIGEVTGFFGLHYEITSKIVRLLGGKVGKRVYWPGHGPSIQDFDLIDIGDDVIFGSRSQLITSDGIGCDYVRIGDGAMVADRVTTMPGTFIGEQAVLGSGTLTHRNGVYAPNSVYIGNKDGAPICLSSGSNFSTPKMSFDDAASKWDEKKVAIEQMTELRPPSPDSNGSSGASSPLLGHGSSSSSPSPSCSTPFGRAFYQNQAPYKVYNLFTITMYSTFINILISLYWNVPTVLTVQLLSRIANRSHMSNVYGESLYRPFLMLSTLVVCFSFFEILLSVIALAICIAAKWILIGRRHEGNYDWDKSPYCQRWQILLTIERIRSPLLGGDGILSMITGTHYMATYFRLLGGKIGKDCALFAGGEMTLSFTEPDLLTLGDRVTVDDASLVAHINSRGTFDLNPLVVGDRSVLRTGSRLLSGAVMGKDTCLLEHTLVMTGDDVEDGATCQGWPSDGFTKSRIDMENLKAKEESIEEKQGKSATNLNLSIRSKLLNRLWKRQNLVRYEMISEMGELER